jgi:carboxylesterase type B
MVVTINYRLGALGFWTSDELAKEEGSGGGNGGMNGINDMVSGVIVLSTS